MTEEWVVVSSVSHEVLDKINKTELTNLNYSSVTYTKTCNKQNAKAKKK